MNRLQAAEQLRRALQLFAATLSEDKALEVASVYPAWETARAYAVGDIVSYGTNPVGDPQLYKVVQAHTSQADWPPDAAPALYDAFGLDDAGYPLWAQPSGAHDAYNAGDIVNYYYHTPRLRGGVEVGISILLWCLTAASSFSLSPSSIPSHSNSRARISAPRSPWSKLAASAKVL